MSNAEIDAALLAVAEGLNLVDQQQRVVAIELADPHIKDWTCPRTDAVVTVCQGETNRYRLASGEWHDL